MFSLDSIHRKSSALMLLIVAATIGLGSSFARADDAPGYDQLRRDLRKAYRSANYKKALETAEKIHELRPGNIDVIYNISCLNCLLGNKARAYEWIDKAIEAGYNDADSLQNDADFRTIRGEDRFRRLIRRIRARNQRPMTGSRDEAGKKKTVKPKKADREEMSSRDRMMKIRELTGRLVAESSEGNREASLKLSLEALDHAKILYENNRDDERFGQIVKGQLSLTYYNAACMYSLMNKKDKAFAHLGKAIKLGSFNGGDLGDQIEDDADFDNIRKDRRYAALLRKARGEKETPRVEMSDEERMEKVGRLSRTMFEASEKKEYEKALEAALAVCELTDNAVSHYNVACMYSLCKRPDKAFDALNRAIEKGGFPGNIVDQMEGDGDLDNIRKDRRYAAAVKKAKTGRSGNTRRGNRRRGQRRAEAPPERKEETVDFDWKVTLPEGFDKSHKAPLLVALHHYHGSMKRTTERWRAAAAEVGAILLTPQGTVDMGNGLYHWGRDLDVIEKNVMRAINKVQDRYNVDPDKIVLAGFSQGGWATWGLSLRNPDAFCGIIPVAGRFDPKSDAVFEDDDLRHMRVFIMIGEDDNSQVLDMNRDAVKRFKKIGAKVKMSVYEDVGHSFPDNETEEQIKALHFVLKR